LSAIGNNFNQAVHKLHMTDNNAQKIHWYEINHSLQMQLVSQMKTIRQFMEDIHRALLATNEDQNEIRMNSSPTN
jgi:hypothetical protein